MRYHYIMSPTQPLGQRKYVHQLTKTQADSTVAIGILQASEMAKHNDKN